MSGCQRLWTVSFSLGWLREIDLDQCLGHASVSSLVVAKQSDGKQSGRRLLGIDVARARLSLDDAAAVEHQQAVGDVQGEAQHLLGHHDRQARASSRISFRISASSLMIDGWMPSVGSSSSSTLGSLASARAMASCCCWPPDRLPPAPPLHLAQHREEARRSRSGTALACRARSPVLMFSSTVSVGKIIRPCGT